MKHQRRVRKRRSQERRQLVAPVLLLFIFSFCVLDLYYVVTLKKEGKLAEIKPALQHQKEQIREAIDNAIHHHRDGGHADVGADDDDDKGPIYEILEQAGIHRSSLDAATRQQLPTWTQVTKLYGDHPIIYGLERCESFTSSIDPSVSFFGIAGTFNSGTNLLAEILIQNCQITKRMEKFGTEQKGMRWQVPWGKHTPVEFRDAHVTTTDKDVPLENSFPMIAIRDPYRWLMSMCRHKYTVNWFHNKTACPNLYSEQLGKINPVKVRYAAMRDSKPHLPAIYNDFYNSYLTAEFPRVLVRFEDLLFFGKNVTQTLCKCGGGDPRRSHFRHVSESAKLGTAAHGADKTSLLQAIIRYGKGDDRTVGMTQKDLQLAKELFDPKLLEMFRYTHP